MKKLLSTLALLFTTVVFGQTLPAPSNGHWVILDTTYTVGTSAVGTTEADLYLLIINNKQSKLLNMLCD